MIDLERLVRSIDNQVLPNWSIQGPWNRSITVPYGHENKPRDYLYAGEMGSSFYDVYHRLKGDKPTNFATEPQRRKMEAGNFYEAIVVWSTRRVGMLKETQGRIRLDDPDYLSVSGKFDILAAHDGNWEKTKEDTEAFFAKVEGKFVAQQELMSELLSIAGIPVDENTLRSFSCGSEFSKITGFDLPWLYFVKKVSLETITHLSVECPSGFDEKIYEVKSINSNAFWSDDKPISKPYEHHIRQLTFYQTFRKPDQITPGSFLYIDRDTMSISEIPNIVNVNVIKDMTAWLEKMTYYYRNNIEPPKPDFVVFDTKTYKYQFNWQIGRSEYRDVIMKGVDMDKIKEEVKQKNVALREKSLMRSAFNNKTKHGNKKYKTAIELLKKGIAIDAVIKKTGVSAIAIAYLDTLKTNKVVEDNLDLFDDDDEEQSEQ